MGRIKDALKPVDCVEVTTLIDNYADALLESTDIVTRAQNHEGEVIPEDTLLAEHGLCLMVTVHENGGRHSIFFDAGYTKVGVLHNLDMLKLELNEIEGLVVSHRHMDHTAGLYALLDRIAHPVDLVVHPEAFLYERYRRMKDGKLIRFPKILSREKLAAYDVTIRESEAPLLIAGEGIAVTGRVERTTAFEKGMQNALVEKDGRMEQDPVADDQALIIHLRGKGAGGRFRLQPFRDRQHRQIRRENNGHRKGSRGPRGFSSDRSRL
ncbi:MAG: MBL fold metallo-hydrolase [Pseudomonadota bacterium]